MQQRFYEEKLSPWKMTALFYCEATRSGVPDRNFRLLVGSDSYCEATRFRGTRPQSSIARRVGFLFFVDYCSSLFSKLNNESLLKFTVNGIENE